MCHHLSVTYYFELVPLLANTSKHEQITRTFSGDPKSTAAAEQQGFRYGGGNAGSPSAGGFKGARSGSPAAGGFKGAQKALVSDKLYPR